MWCTVPHLGKMLLGLGMARSQVNLCAGRWTETRGRVPLEASAAAFPGRLAERTWPYPVKRMGFLARRSGSWARSIVLTEAPIATLSVQRPGLREAHDDNVTCELPADAGSHQRHAKLASRDGTLPIESGAERRGAVIIAAPLATGF